MPRGDKDKYTDKQKRKAKVIEDSYEAKGVPKDEAERRAWGTVNNQVAVNARVALGRKPPKQPRPRLENHQPGELQRPGKWFRILISD